MNHRTILIIGGIAESLVRFRGDLLKELVSLGHKVHAAAGSDIDNKTEETLKSWGVQYHPLPLERTGLNPMADAKTFLHLLRLCKRLKPDDVLSYTLKPVLYGSLASRLAGIARSYSMITGLGYAFSGEGLKRSLLRKVFIEPLLVRALRGNELVFFQNPDDIALFRSHGLVDVAKPTRLLGGSGVNLREYQRAPYPKRLTFLLIARLLSEKGVREYVDAARCIRSEFPDSRFLIVGWIDGQNPTAIRAEELDQWSADGIIEFKGRLADVRPAIAEASVYVLPSYYREGIPRSILEAMAMGRPIITTDTPGCRETVREGTNGYLVAPRSGEAIVEAMRQFAIHPNLIEKMGEESWKLASSRFDVRKVNHDIVQAMGLEEEKNALSGPLREAKV